jgi:hypothetical protein
VSHTTTITGGQLNDRRSGRRGDALVIVGFTLGALIVLATLIFPVYQGVENHHLLTQAATQAAAAKTQADKDEALALSLASTLKVHTSEIADVQHALSALLATDHGESHAYDQAILADLEAFCVSERVLCPPPPKGASP